MTDSVKTEIEILERRLINISPNHDAQEIETLVADDFIEIGTSGRVYRKADVLIYRHEDDSLQVTILEFVVAALSKDIVCATYKTLKSRSTEDSKEQALRSSIWRRTATGWQIVFHQGTLVAQP